MLWCCCDHSTVVPSGCVNYDVFQSTPGGPRLIDAIGSIPGRGVFALSGSARTFPVFPPFLEYVVSTWATCRFQKDLSPVAATLRVEFFAGETATQTLNHIVGISLNQRTLKVLPPDPGTIPDDFYSPLGSEYGIIQAPDSTQTIDFDVTDQVVPHFGGTGALFFDVWIREDPQRLPPSGLHNEYNLLSVDILLTL